MTDNERDVYESLRDELVRTNRKLHEREQTAVGFLRSRTEALRELREERERSQKLKDLLERLTRERDAARTELRRVLAGTGFRIKTGEAS